MMGRHQYLNEDEYEVNLKDFESQPGKLLDNSFSFGLLKFLCQLLLSLTQGAERVFVLFT